MQNVPGAFPARISTEQNEPEELATSLSLLEAVHARRAEYVRPRHVRIKIGTWNVAAHKGTEKDVGGWLVEGKGISKTLSGLSVGDESSSMQYEGLVGANSENTEDVLAQEARFVKKQSTIPRDDPGTLPGDENVGLYVLGLQEVVDITSTAEALRPYTDPAVAKKYKDELEMALPEGYRLVAEQQLIGLLLLIYASPDIANDVKSVSTTSVGTGLMGYMGNKGAVTARIVLGDTTRLVFVNCHLAAGADKASLERRNWDASQIVQRTKFEPIQDSMDLSQTTGEQIGDEDFAFWVGDLNYRLETIPGDDVRRLLMLHARNEYDLSRRRAVHKIDKEIGIAAQSARRKRQHAASLSSVTSSDANSPRPSSDASETNTDSTAPSTVVDDIGPDDDPTSLQTTISSLLPHDELQQQMKAGKAFHDGWREGPIAFLPTYKYDVGSVGVFDSSEKKRAPSWCDRILYRTRRDKLAYDAKVQEKDNAKKRDEEMRANGTDQGGEDDEILYDYDPQTDGIDPADDYDADAEYDEAQDGMQLVTTREGVEDEIRVEYYTAHQRVLSSDHKPLDAVFMLKYEAVVPEWKAKVHAEVAKDFDKAENEGRPNVTVVVDQQNDKQTEQCDESCKGFEGVSFGDVRWNQSKVRTLTVANTSRVQASFSFIERPTGPDQVSGIAPMWLILTLNGTTVSSSTTATSPMVLEPGDAASVELDIRVSDSSFVRDLNEGVSSLEDVLVLRVDGGRDHFIPVKAKWLDTSLGRSIDKLIRIPEGGIRKLQSQRPDKSKSNDQSKSSSGTASPVVDEPVRFSAPRELFRLTEAIEEMVPRVVAEWDMISSDSETAPWLQHAGWPFEEECWSERSTASWQHSLYEVCDALDTDEPLSECFTPETPRIQSLYVLCDFLLVFLHSIPEGIITADLWSQIEGFLVQLDKAKHRPPIEEQRTSLQEILSQSPSHSISFILLTTMLDRLLQEIAGVSQGKDELPSSPHAKRSGTFRRVTGSFGRTAASSRREKACSALSHIFAPAIFGAPLAGIGKHGSAQRRKVEFIEIFLAKGATL